VSRIEFKDVRHAYPQPAGQPQEYALKEVNQVWENGGAYALLGPSGCGKTTLLNIISGLLTPSEGSILFNHDDVTRLPTAERHIAQVFQFPVVYDTMTVFDICRRPASRRGSPKLPRCWICRADYINARPD
jgi:glycerol transport system ATP-binding protein